MNMKSPAVTPHRMPPAIHQVKGHRRGDAERSIDQRHGEEIARHEPFRAAQAGDDLDAVHFDGDQTARAP